MKNLNKGFVVPLLLGIIVVLVVGGGVYVYNKEKVEAPAVVDTETQQSDQIQQQTNTQIPPTTNSNNPNPSLAVISPKGGEVWQKGKTYQITWQTENIISLSSYNGIVIYLTDEESRIISKIVPESSRLSSSAKSYLWTIPSSVLSGKYNIMVTLISGIDSSVYNFSKNFTITPATVTSNWKIYTNSKYGFESKYPKNYSTFRVSGDSSVSFRSTEACKSLISGGGEWPIDCQAYDIIVQQNKIVADGVDISKSFIVVAGMQAEKITIPNGMWDDMTQILVQFQKGQNWYIQTFSFDRGKSQVAESVMNQILSTFKFTK